MTKEPRDMTWRELIEEAVAENGDTGKEIICTLPIEVLDKEADCNDENWTAWCGDWIYTPGWEYEVNPYVYASRRNPDSEEQHTKWKAEQVSKQDEKPITEYIFRSEDDPEILAEATVQGDHYQLSHTLGAYVLLKNTEIVAEMDETIYDGAGKNKDKLLTEYITRYLDR